MNKDHLPPAALCKALWNRHTHAEHLAVVGTDKAAVKAKMRELRESGMPPVRRTISLLPKGGPPPPDIHVTGTGRFAHTPRINRSHAARHSRDDGGFQGRVVNRLREGCGDAGFANAQAREAGRDAHDRVTRVYRRSKPVWRLRFESSFPSGAARSASPRSVVGCRAQEVPTSTHRT